VQSNGEEIDLEIEAPGSASEVAEQGSLTIQDEQEYQNLEKKLADSRKKKENKIGKGG